MYASAERLQIEVLELDFSKAFDRVHHHLLVVRANSRHVDSLDLQFRCFIVISMAEDFKFCSVQRYLLDLWPPLKYIRASTNSV